MADEGETIRTIYQKCWFVIIPAKVLGLLPLRIHGNRLTREELFARMCSIFIMVFSSFCTICFLWEFIWILPLYKMDKILNAGFLEVLSHTGIFVVMITDVYREFTDAHTGLQIIESLAKYDRRVKQLGLARKDHFLFTWIITLSIILLVFAEINYNIRNKRIISNLIVSGTIIMKIACHLARLKFAIIVHLLYQRYKHLNDIVLPKDQWRMRGNMALNRRVVNMHDLVYLHSTLTRATKIFIKVYSLELLVWIISPIWEFNLGLYYVKYGFKLINRLRHVNLGYQFAIRFFSAAAQVLVAIWSLCWICQTTANEANKFAMQILRTDPELIRSRDIDEQLDAAIYMNNNKISFRVLNLYDVNFRTLVFVSLFNDERIAVATFTLSLGCVIFDGQHYISDYKKSHHA